MKFVRFDSDSPLYDDEIVLRNRVLREPLGMELTPEFLKNDKDNSHFCLINSDGNMIACLLIKEITKERVKLRQMAVSENERGKGLGALLIRKTEKILKDEGYLEIELHSRGYAKGFYLKSGFEQVGKELEEIGIPHIKMVKKINPF